MRLKSLYLIKPTIAANRTKIIIGLLSLIIVDILQLIIPRIIKRVVDELTLFQAEPLALWRYAAAIIGVGLLIGGFRYVWRRNLLGTSRRVEEALRNRLFAHLQALSPAYFDQTATGDLMAHATNDINQIRMATGMGMVALNDAVVLGAAAVGFMAYIDLRLTLLVLIPAPLIVLGTRFFSRQMHRRYQKVQQAFSDLTEVVRERLAGIRIVKAYAWQAQSTRAVTAASRRYVRHNIELAKITGTFMPMMLLLTNLSMAVVLLVGGRFTILQTITPGDFVAFISYLGLLTWPMMAMGWVTNLIQRGRASLDRLQIILETEPRVTDPPDAREDLQPPYGLELDALRFHYAGRSEKENAVPALAGVTLTVSPGETIGLTGPPGGGKTTLLQLIPRLYDPVAGAIRINGIDLRTIRLAKLRRLVTFVPQEPFLFATSVRENITLGRPVSEDQLARAVDQAALTETLALFPQGLETPVGEKGTILSGGQKQRIVIARALLSESPFLLLDDPVSQVDTATAGKIIAALRALQGRRTLLMVSQRLSALRHSDRIVVIDQGRVIAAGRHAELIQQPGYYADVWRRQAFREERDAA
ncbi:MAG: ABC transporter ATP-binding protein [Desulfosarcina sp.]|nr:ABC transporter ATP-binding protein [Desulfobacterales bacterium]